MTENKKETKQKAEDKNMKEEKKEEKKVETKKQETKKAEKKPKPVKKDKVVANAFAARISPKQSFAICKMIRGKTPERAVEMLGNVVKGKQPVKMPMREVAHQKGKGIAGAKFPKNAAEAFIPLVKGLSANAQALGVENPIISIAMANKARKVYRRGGKEAKRTHLHLEAISKTKLTDKKKK
jgi:ribosomal protein L22